MARAGLGLLGDADLSQFEDLYGLGKEHLWALRCNKKSQEP